MLYDGTIQIEVSLIMEIFYIYKDDINHLRLLSHIAGTSLHLLHPTL